MHSTIHGKRLGDPLDAAYQPEVKKRRVKEEGSSALFKIITIDNASELDKNLIYMHEINAKEFFGTYDIVPYFISIGEFVYEVAINNIRLNAICINSLQKIELEDSILWLDNDPSALISPFFCESRNVIPLLKVHIEIRFDYLRPLQTTYDYEDLKKHCITKLSGKIIRKNQRFTLDSQENRITAKIKSCQAALDVLDHYNPPFAMFTSDTDVHFDNMSASKVSIVREIIGNPLTRCHFFVTSKQFALKKDSFFFPKPEISLVVDYNQFCTVVYNSLRFDTLHSGFTKNIEFEGKSFDLIVQVLNTKYPLSIDDTRHKNGIYLSPKTEFLFVGPSQQILFAGGVVAPAKSATFKVIETSFHPLNPWIEKGELQEMIKLKKELVLGQQFNVDTKAGTIIMRLENAGSFPDGKCAGVNFDVKFQSKWCFPDICIFDIKIDPLLKLALIENSAPEVLKEVTIEVAFLEDLSHSTILRNSQQTKKNPEVLEVDLREAIQKLEPKPIVENQTFAVKIYGETFILKAKNFVYENKELKKDFSYLGSVSDETRISFTKDNSSNLKIMPRKKDLQSDQLITKLNKIGLGGMEAQLEELIRKIVIFQDASLEEELKLCGMKPPRGMLFYGPPGTGKTTLARNLAEHLGVDVGNFKFISGSENLKKYLGESENMIRSHFVEAEAAQKKYGNKSPFYVIVFDEFDSIAGKRKSKNPLWSVSIVNQLLASMDGSNDLNNILVIGITNRLESLDPAIMRPGRFEVHLKFSLPDEAGRLEIFEIHTRKLAANNSLAKDVDLKALAKKTKEFSGADIMGLVNAAYSFRNLRLLQTKGMQKEERDKLLQVTKNDFKRALEEVSKTKCIEEDKSVPFGMYL